MIEKFEGFVKGVFRNPRIERVMRSARKSARKRAWINRPADKDMLICVRRLTWICDFRDLGVVNSAGRVLGVDDATVGGESGFFDALGECGVCVVAAL